MKLDETVDLGLLDRWRAYFYNSGKPLKQHQLSGSYYKNLRPISQIEPFRTTGLEWDRFSDLAQALDGFGIDE